VTTFPLRQLRLRPGEEFRDAVAITLEPFDLGGERYLPVPQEVQAELEVQRASSGDVFRLRFEMRLHGPCMRCLRDAVAEIGVDTLEYHAAAEGADAELQTEYVVADQLELSQWARDATALMLPSQILCRPDCAGLCPVCGKDLNDEPHGHDEPAVDSRWAALEQLRTDV